MPGAAAAHKSQDRLGLRIEGTRLRRALFYPPLLILLFVAAAGLVAANQVPRSYHVDAGDPAHEAFVRNFHKPIGRGAARWSGSYSYVVLPGVGGGVPIVLDLDVAGGEDRPGEQALLEVIVNGESIARDLPVPPARGTLRVPVGASHPAALGARDLVVELRSTTYRTETPPVEERGVLVFGLTATFGDGIIWPALRVLGYSLLALLLFYLLLARVLSRRAASIGAAAALGLLLAGVATALPRLAPLLPFVVALPAVGHALLLAGTWAWPALLRFARFELRYLRRGLVYPPVYLLLTLFAIALVAAYQVPHTYFVDLAAPGDDAYARNFHRFEEYGGARALWTDNYAYISLPGIGGGVPLEIDLRVAGGERPDGSTPRLMVIVNGAQVFGEDGISASFQTLNIKIDETNRQVLDQRDLVIELRAPTFLAPDVPGERRGVLVDSVRVAQGSGFIVPTQRVLISLAGALLLLYAWLIRAGFRRIIAFAAAVLAAALLTAVLAWVHLPLSAAAPHLLVTTLSAYALLILGHALRRATAPRLSSDQLSSPTPDDAASAAASPVTRHPPPATSHLSLAAAIFSAGWALRYGAQALPQAEVIDMPYHMKWLRILLSGDWQALYFPGDLSTVPPEWGLSVLIPKSPLFYFFAAPLGLLPFELEPAVKLLITFLDASSILFAFLLVRRWLGGERAGLWAAALYAVLPLSLRSLVYGILPTVQAQWMTWLLFMLLLWQWPRLSRWQVAVPVTLLLAATLVAFPTIAVFNVLMLLGLALLWRPPKGLEGSHWRVSRARPVVLTGAVLAAIVLSVVVYYGQYVEPVFGATLPAMIDQLQGRGPVGVGAGTTRWPGGPLQMIGWTFDYHVSFLPIVAGGAGMALLWPGMAAGRRKGSLAGRTRFIRMLALWLGIGLFFGLANYFVDMIGKHLYYTMLPLCIAGGVALYALAQRRGLTAGLAALSLVALAWSGLSFWINRIVP